MNLSRQLPQQAREFRQQAGFLLLLQGRGCSKPLVQILIGLFLIDRVWVHLFFCAA